MRALVIGGGVGGLSSAIALDRIGFDVQVFERADSLRVTGAGLNLWPNAGRAIYAIGLKEKYDNIAVPVDRYLTLAHTGEVLHEQDVSHWPKKYGAPAVGIYRRSLAEMLLGAVGESRVAFGRKLTGIEDNGEKVTCTFGTGETCTGDVVIGADGIYSTTRQLLFGDFDYHSNEHHTYRWRGIVRLADIGFDHKAETEVFEGDYFFGIIPIDRERAYWYASGPDVNDINTFNERFGSWAGSDVPATIAATSASTVLQTHLQDLSQPPQTWVKGRVALLGDAAHPLMPDMAQGASQTFVDAAVLGECFAEEGSIAEKLRAYEARRQPDAYRAVRLSRNAASLYADDAGQTDKIEPVVVRYELGIEDDKIS